MSDVPNDLRYLSTHEWIRIDENDIGTVGISDHAQQALGDLVFAEVPEIGTVVSAGDETGVVESVKAASDIYAPVSGEIVAINEDLADAPEMINQDPYGDGWIYQIRLSDPEEVDALMTAADYKEQVLEDEADEDDD
ncbi:MAG: glycine cleavage system protein GcvH [Pseudomonadota bacterium]